MIRNIKIDLLSLRGTRRASNETLTSKDLNSFSHHQQDNESEQPLAVHHPLFSCETHRETNSMMQSFSLNVSAHISQPQPKSYDISYCKSSFDSFAQFQTRFGEDALHSMDWEASIQKNFGTKSLTLFNGDHSMAFKEWIPSKPYKVSKDSKDSNIELTMDTINNEEQKQSEDESQKKINNRSWAPVPKNRTRSRIEKEKQREREEEEETDDKMDGEDCFTSGSKMVLHSDDEEDESQINESAANSKDSDDDQNEGESLLGHLVWDDDDEESDIEDIICSIKRKLSF